MTTEYDAELTTEWFDGLVSPRTGEQLYLKDNKLYSPKTGESFEICDQVAQLLVPEFEEDSLKEEIEAMQNLPIFGVNYFQKKFVQTIADRLFSLVPPRTGPPINFIEVGGGDGQFARCFLGFPGVRVFIGDICQKFLDLSPDSIRKVCCDACYPYFSKEGLDIAVFWVSFHHLPIENHNQALKVAVDSLRPGGVLVFFEPNTFYLPRHILLKTGLQKDVYFDENEKPVNPLTLHEQLVALGLREVFTETIQPPYSIKFLKKLKNWWFYFLVVELMYRIDRFFILPLTSLFFGRHKALFKWLRKYMASYFLAVYKKPS